MTFCNVDKDNEPDVLSTLQKVMDRKAAVEVDASSAVVACNAMIVGDSDDDNKRCEDGTVNVDFDGGVIIQASTETAVKTTRQIPLATSFIIVVSGVDE